MNLDFEISQQIYAYPRDWQTPTATERFAFDAMMATPRRSDSAYVAYPWATLFEGLVRNKPGVEIMFAVLDRLREAVAGHSNVVTVCQHYALRQNIDLVQAAGVTHVCWPHKTQDSQIENISLSPFPLVPVQFSPFKRLTTMPENRYLASFVGAHNSRYMSETRPAIFQRRRTSERLRIVQRGSWHFSRRVYEEQFHNRLPSADEVVQELEFARQFKTLMRQSAFSLCPTGMGPATTRIYEALAAGSIPVILSTDLDLPGDAGLWQQASVIEEDSEAGLVRALDRISNFSEHEIMGMQSAGEVLFPTISPINYHQFIDHAYEGSS